MKPASNTYALPERMKRADVHPAPPRPQPLRHAPAILLAMGSLCCLLCFLLYCFEPAEPWREWYVPVSNLAFTSCLFSYLLAFALSLVGVVRNWSRFRNAWVLLGCFALPIACMLLATVLYVLVVG